MAEEVFVVGDTIVLMERPRTEAVPVSSEMGPNSEPLCLSEKAVDESAMDTESSNSCSKDTKVDFKNSYKCRVSWIAFLTFIGIVVAFGHSINWNVSLDARSLPPYTPDIAATYGRRLVFSVLLVVVGIITCAMCFFTWLAGRNQVLLFLLLERLPTTRGEGAGEREAQVKWRVVLLTVASLIGCVGAVLLVASAAVSATLPHHVVLMGAALGCKFLWGAGYLIVMSRVARFSRRGRMTIVAMWAGLATMLVGAIFAGYFLYANKTHATALCASCIVAGVGSLLVGVGLLNFDERITLAN